jgi:Putative cyclase
VTVTRDELTAEQFERWVKDLHRAQRHDAGDELGSLNYLDEAARARGRDAIRTGAAVVLASRLQSGPTVRHDGESTFQLEVYATSSASGFPMPEGFGIQSDRVELDCHGLVNTHLDALNHMGFFGVWFDGSPNSTTTRSGSVLALAEFGIFTRGVHVDIAAVRGKPFVGPEYPVSGEEIDRALARAGVTFAPGDALLLDCGRDRFESEFGPWGDASPRPGAGPGVAEWLERHDPSLVCWDMLEGDNEQNIIGPVHHLNWAIGLVLVDNCTFAQARHALAERSTAVGALAVAPLPIDGATGGNVNPLLLV